MVLVTGKSGLALELAKFYSAALLSLDAIVMEAIVNGNTPAGMRARALCSEAAHKRAEEQRLQQGESGETVTLDSKKGGL